jgi:hypothetical protein
MTTESPDQEAARIAAEQEAGSLANEFKEGDAAPREPKVHAVTINMGDDVYVRFEVASKRLGLGVTHVLWQLVSDFLAREEREANVRQIADAFKGLAESHALIAGDMAYNTERRY